MNDFFDSTGRRIPLGKQIGSGGEGAVYEVPAIGNDTVAKIYHHALATEKQIKLHEMVKGGSVALKKVAAWPLDTLHVAAGGSIRGFLMPKLTGYEPIHHLYNPGHRKQRYPDKDWTFLIYVARNTAATFETIHTHKHIIGDVNPNLVFVSENSTVKLIDCDSFQIFVDGKYHLCEVGVPHFTPPELQIHSSFRGIHRNINHDNFGLALLIFHLLLMGRHPFAGLFPGTDDMPLEKSIEQFNYTFSHNAAAKGMSPPPNSVTTAILSPSITQLFERAFTEPGQQQRPTAKEWRQSLDIFRGQLNTCGQKSIHRYFNNLNACPWCLHEQKFKHQFFIAVVNKTTTDFDLTVVWAKIIAISSPGIATQFNVPAIHTNAITPKPIPDAIKQARELINAVPTFKDHADSSESEAVKNANQAEIQANQAANTASRSVRNAEAELNSIKPEMDSASELLKDAESAVKFANKSLEEAIIAVNTANTALTHTNSSLYNTNECSIKKRIAELTKKIEQSKKSMFAFFKKSTQQKMQIELDELLLNLDKTKKQESIEREQREQSYRVLLDAKEKEENARRILNVCEQQLTKTREIELAIKLKFNAAKRNLDDAKEKENIAWHIFRTAQANIKKIKEQEKNKQLDTIKTNLAHLEAQERQQRSNALSDAQHRLNELQINWQNVSSDEPFQTALKKLKEQRNEYENLLQEITLEQQKLQQNLPNIQLRKFLESQFLDQHKITEIGQTRKAVLATHGIETAADIDESRLANIKGFGRQLINILLDWRKSLEQNFTFDPSKGVDPADIAAVQQRFAPKLQQIENYLLAGSEQLNQIKTQILQQRTQLLTQINQVYYQVAQAKADLQILL
jgi:DNA-binding helix-hairpin-helix protein with protein kinase domain